MARRAFSLTILAFRTLLQADRALQFLSSAPSPIRNPIAVQGLKGFWFVQKRDRHV